MLFRVLAGGEKVRILEFDLDGGDVSGTIRGPILKVDKVWPMYAANDQKKAQKFLQGLRKKVKQVLYAWNISTFVDAIEKATTIERNMVSQGELRLGGNYKTKEKDKYK